MIAALSRTLVRVHCSSISLSADPLLSGAWAAEYSSSIPYSLQKSSKIEHVFSSDLSGLNFEW